MNTIPAPSIPTTYSPLRKALEFEMLSSMKSPRSPLERVLYYWKGNPSMRIAIGFGLLGGGLIATATGSFATAGIILGARAGVSALGAFTSSKGLYEVIRGKYGLTTMETLIHRVKHIQEPAALDRLMQEIESTYSDEQAKTMLLEHHVSVRKHTIIANIVGATTATVAGILALNVGSEMISAGVSQPVISPIAPPSPTFDIGQIAQDIRQDHPKQGWITLEQMIRRVEGLKMGIGLHQSEQLVPLNQSISEIVHHPQGIIAETLRNRGYSDHISIDTIARQLSEQEIKEITKIYIEQTSPVIDVPLEVITHEKILYPEIPLVNTSFEMGLGVMGGGMILGAGGYIGYRLVRYKATPAPTVVSIEKINALKVIAPENSLLTGDRIQNSDGLANTGNQSVDGEKLEVISDGLPVDQIGTESIVKHEETLTGNDKVSTFQLSESALRIQKQIHEHFLNIYGWEIDNEIESFDSNKHIDRYRGSTVGGQYQVLVAYTESGVQATIVWYDHDAARSHVQSEITSYTSLLSPLSPEFSLESMLDTLYFDMLIQRETIKSGDMRDILAVSLPRSHLQVIYEHIEIPKVRDANLEVLGFWMASAYDIDHQTLPLNILANPVVEDQTITNTSCRPKNLEIARDFYLLYPNDLIHHTFPKKESELILGKRLGEFGPDGRRRIIFSGAMRAINWHKHPDYLSRPSQGDIEEAKRDLKMQYPGAETHPYTIAVRITEEEVSRLSHDSYVVVLPRSVYGGQFSYALRSYQLLFEDNEFKEMRPLKIHIN